MDPNDTRCLSELASTIPTSVWEKDAQRKQVPMSSFESDAVCTTKVTSQEYSINKISAPRRGIIEDFLTIWLDSNTDMSNSDYENSIIDLQSIGNSIKIFHNGNECINFLHNVKDSKVVLILSDPFDIMYISLIHDAPQLDSIYILCLKSTHHEHLLKEWRKIRGIFSDISVICHQIKKNTRQREHNLIPFSVIPASYPINMNELDPSFMYSQLLKDILLEMQYNEDARRKFASFLHTQYAENTSTLRLIDKFEQDYDEQSPIWWYTKESFIYSVLNKALRTQDIAIIIKMGFLVQDLSRQIEGVHSKMRQQTKQIIYRGQVLPSIDFEKIKKNQGGLLSFNNFLSTSTDQQVACVFADTDRIDSDLIGIIFQMEIDPLISSTPFASLNEISFHSDSESEILFSMHTVFRIGNTSQINDQLWQVNLMLTSDNDEQLKQLSDYIRKEFEGFTANHRLGKLMIRMDKLGKAEEIFTELLESASDKSLQEIADLHSELGGIKYSQGDPSNALVHFEKALEIKEKILLPTDPYLARTYSSIGTAHCSMANYSTALSYHKKALKIREEVLPPLDPDLGVAYNNLGAVHNAMGDYSTALEYCQKALVIREKILPSIHPTLAITYNNIGRLHKVMGEYSTALSFYEKTLQIEQKSLPPTHSSLSTTYNNMARVYEALEDYSSALMHYEKTLKIQQESLPPIHPNLAITYNNMGSVHIYMNDCSTALSHLEKALEIQQKSSPTIHPILANMYCNFGRVYALMGDYSTALSYYEKTLEIQQKSFPPSHPDFALTYSKMGGVLNSLDRYEEAVVCAERAVDITRDTFGCDHPTFRIYQQDVEQLRQKL